MANIGNFSHFERAAEIFNLEYANPENNNTAIAKFFVLTNTSNMHTLKNYINFVDFVDPKWKLEVYKALNEAINIQNLTSEPEMLLLQKIINKQYSRIILHDTMKQVDADCRKIITRIVEGIWENDYSISINIAESIDSTVLSNNMLKIVREFYNGTLPTLENTLLLMNYSLGLPYISNQCFLIDALLKELEKRQLLDSEQAMHLWAHAKYTKEEQPNWPKVAASAQKLCTDAIDKLSPNKQKFYQHYQKYVEDPDKEKIKELHKNNWHLESIVGDFVSFYYNGDLGRTQNLLAAARAIVSYSAVGRILSQLHEEMDNKKQLNSFEVFRLFNEVKRCISFSNFISLNTDLKKTFEKLKEKAPACLRQLLWPQSSSFDGILLFNRFHNKRLTHSSISHTRYPILVDQSTASDDDDDKWQIKVDEESSLVTISLKSGGSIGVAVKDILTIFDDSSLDESCWWMIKSVDDLHFKIFNANGQFISALIEESKMVCLKNETSALTDQWKITNSNS